MNIVFVSYSYSPPYFGGGLNRMIKHLGSLVARGHQVTVLTSGVPGYPASETRDGILIRRSPIIHIDRIGRGFRRLFFPLWVNTVLPRFDPEIIHIESLGGINPVTDYFASLLLTSTARRISAKTIKQHTLADSENQMFRVVGLKFRLRLDAWKHFDAVVSISPALHQSVSKYFTGKAFCIMNGVKTDVFSPLPADIRKEFRFKHGIDNAQVVFSFLGSIGYRKGFDLLARAFLDLSQVYPDWRLWVIGPRSRLENQNIDEDEVNELTSILKPCMDKVIYWGRVDDQQKLVKILGASDVFVFPSRKEGFGNAPLEAMSCAVPVILSLIPGVTDQASVDGVTGRYFQVGDLEKLKMNMVDLGTNHDKRTRFGSAARLRVEYEFNWDQYMDKWEALYKRIKKNG